MAPSLVFVLLLSLSPIFGPDKYNNIAQIGILKAKKRHLNAKKVRLQQLIIWHFKYLNWRLSFYEMDHWSKLEIVKYWRQKFHCENFQFYRQNVFSKILAA